MEPDDTGAWAVLGEEDVVVAVAAVGVAAVAAAYPSRISRYNDTEDAHYQVLSVSQQSHRNASLDHNHRDDHLLCLDQEDPPYPVGCSRRR